jgi:hypothetical protein
VGLVTGIRVLAGRGHGGGHMPSPNFYEWAEIHASFGQNIKIPEKLWYGRENVWMFAKIINIRENFFDMSGKFFVCLPNLRVIRENFFGMSRKKNFVPPPLPSLANNFREKY